MKRKVLLAQLSVISACVFALTPSANAAEHLLLTNGQFYTPSGWKEAVAISDGVIVEIGDAQSLAKLRTDSTRVIDLKGDAVLPGLHDSHVHIAGAGLTRLQCRVAQNATGQEFLDFVAGCARARKAGEWIVGGQYSAAAFGKQRPNKKLLDTVAPNNPAIMGDISGHSSWVNTRALQLAGITRDTPDPPGGVIERDAKGEPTGLLHEAAAGLVRRVVPPYTLEQTTQAIEWSLKLMLSYGITTAVDAGLSEPLLPAFSALADRGKLKQRVHGCIRWSDRNATNGSVPLAESLRVIQTRNLYARERFMPNCVKIVLDGVPTDSHTAAMLDAYVPTHDADHGSNDKGLLMIAPEVLHPAVTWMDAHGLTVKFHAAGDAAVRGGLDAIAAARAANGFSGILHDVGHNSFVNPDDIKRARAIGAVFEFSPYIWFPSPIIRDIRKAVGEERMKRWIPVKDALDAGAPSVAGSDWSVVPSVNPWIALETLVTRQVPGAQGEVLGASQRITLEQAVDLFTSAPAVRMGTRNRVGAIEKGLFADLIVLDRNPFKTPIGDVHNTKVKRVFISGELVFEDAT